MAFAIHIHGYVDPLKYAELVFLPNILICRNGSLGEFLPFFHGHLCSEQIVRIFPRQQMLQPSKIVGIHRNLADFLVFLVTTMAR